MLEATEPSGKPNFHRVAFEQYLLAMQEGKHMDPEYVKRKAYAEYEARLREFHAKNHKIASAENNGIV